MNRLPIVIVLLLWIGTTAQSQEKNIDRYFIYFKDKIGDNYPYSLENPESFLTQRSIERRNKQGIDIDENDLPVNPSYISELRSNGIDVFFSSKWLNGALAQSTPDNIAIIQSLSFVDSVRLIAAKPRLQRIQQVVETPTEFLPPRTIEADTEIQLKMLWADNMHANNIKGQGMLIAVFDNGFRGVNKYAPFLHLWENNQIKATKDFVENTGNVFQFGGHGTGVLSTIAARYDSANFIGIATKADFILCITEDNKAENTVEEYNLLLAAEFADSLGADVINASLGYRVFDIKEHTYSYEDLNGQTPVVSKAAQLAAEKGMIMVASAGNHGDKSWKYLTPPADAKDILTVGSVNVDFTRSSFSSVGPTSDGRIKPDVAAFGNGTAIVSGGGEIIRSGGTSFAAPLIAGFAAGVWQENPDWTSEEVMDAIKKSSTNTNAPDTLIGHGVPNYLFIKEGKLLNIQDILEDKVNVYPNAFDQDKLILKVEAEMTSELNIRILDPSGTMAFNQTFQPSELKERMELSLDGSQQGVYFLFLQTESDQKVVKLINF